MDDNFFPSEKPMDDLEKGIDSVIRGISESRQEFSDKALKYARKELSAARHHKGINMSQKTRRKMLLDQLRKTKSVIKRAMQKSRSVKLLEAYTLAVQLLETFDK